MDLDLPTIIKSFVTTPNDKINTLLKAARSAHTSGTKSKVNFQEIDKEIKYTGDIDMDNLCSRSFFLESILPREESSNNQNNKNNSNTNNNSCDDQQVISMMNLLDLANSCLHCTMSDESYTVIKQCFDRCLERAGVPSNLVISQNCHSRTKLSSLRNVLCQSSESEKDEWLRNEAETLDFLIDINTTGKVPTMNIFV